MPTTFLPPNSSPPRRRLPSSPAPALATSPSSSESSTNVSPRTDSDVIQLPFLQLRDFGGNLTRNLRRTSRYYCHGKSKDFCREDELADDEDGDENNDDEEEDEFQFPVPPGDQGWARRVGCDENCGDDTRLGMVPFPLISGAVPRKQPRKDEISISGSDFSQFPAFAFDYSRSVAPSATNDQNLSLPRPVLFPRRNSSSLPRSNSSPVLLSERPRATRHPLYYPGHRHPSSRDSYPRPNPPSFVHLKIEGLIPLENSRPAPSPPSSTSVLPQSLHGFPLPALPPSRRSSSFSSSHYERGYLDPSLPCSAFSRHTTPRHSLSSSSGSIPADSSCAFSQYRIPVTPNASPTETETGCWSYLIPKTGPIPVKTRVRARAWSTGRSSVASERSAWRGRDSRGTGSIVKVDEEGGEEPEGGGAGGDGKRLALETLVEPEATPTKPRLVRLKKSLSLLWPRKSSRSRGTSA